VPYRVEIYFVNFLRGGGRLACRQAGAAVEIISFTFEGGGWWLW